MAKSRRKRQTSTNEQNKTMPPRHGCHGKLTNECKTERERQRCSTVQGGMDSYWGTHTAACQQRRLEFQSTSTSQRQQQQNQRENEKQRRVKATVAQTTATPATREKPKTTRRATPRKTRHQMRLPLEKRQWTTQMETTRHDGRSQLNRSLVATIPTMMHPSPSLFLWSFLGHLTLVMNSNQVVPLQRIAVETTTDGVHVWSLTWVTDKGGRER